MEQDLDKTYMQTQVEIVINNVNLNPYGMGVKETTELEQYFLRGITKGSERERCLPSRMFGG
jgi:hypothetical protein